jgi:hypothetical protein
MDTAVRVGQIWQDNDPRFKVVRLLEVVRILGDKAECNVTLDGKAGRPTKVQLSRFKPTSTGYKLLKGAHS